MKILILAGGSGTRLWPLSRKSLPKQFLKLGNEFSFLQQTVKRALAIVAAEDILILTHQEYLHPIKREIEEIAPSIVQNILLEPLSKNTAPAISFAVKELLARGASVEEQLLVLPSDHLVTPVEKFCDHVERASQLADNALVTFGVRPSRPETGYGYIECTGDKVIFIEKPTLEKAKSLLHSGNVYWNAGIFLFSLKVFLEEVNLYAPDIYDYIKKEVSFEELKSISFDYAIMEHSSRVKMIPLDLIWSDVGSWENIFELSPKDENNNVLKGTVYASKTENCLVYAQNRLVTTMGVKDLYIVETADALLVMHKSEAQRVRELVEGLKRAKISESTEHKTIYRPWGSYTVLEEGHRYKIKQIHVDPHQTLSLQMHYHRSEHWVVVSGTARVTIGDKEQIIHEEQSIFVPKSAIHRVTNPGKVPLKIIEVQVGEYLGEDDIVRLEDIYGRELENKLVLNR